MAIRCPKCGSPKNFSIRHQALTIQTGETLDIVRRTRKCSTCGKVFKTIEMLESDEVTRLPKVGFRGMMKDETTF